MQGGGDVKISVRNSCSEFNSYRAARVKSLFNCDSGAEFNLDVELPIDNDDWRVGVVVGPSGSGKTSIGRRIFGAENFYEPSGWTDQPIVDCILPSGGFDDVTAALAAVGLGSVPAWLRPYAVLSNGEKFRADLARIVAEQPAKVVVDEFTSVVDRQIAKVGALAFQKAWRRTKGQAVLLSCHYDILDWLEPDWIFDTATGQFTGRGLRRRPPIQLEIWQTNWRYWPEFEPHHYLKLPKMPASICYVGVVEGERVAHVAVSSMQTGLGIEARACRLVVMPEWQGAGVGLRFLNEVCDRQLRGEGRMPGRKVPTVFHTSHPGLAAALRRSKSWQQISAKLYGDNKARSMASMVKSKALVQSGYGGHFRAVQGFRYVGAPK